MKRIGIILVVIAIFGAIGWFFYQQPYRAYEQLRSAAQENDSVAFGELVDQDKIKAFLRQDIKEDVIKNASHVPNNEFSKKAYELADVMLDTLIQPIITPQGIYQLLTEGQLDAALFGLTNKPAEKEVVDNKPDDLLAADQAADDKKPQTITLTEETGYDSLTSFKVKLEAPGQVKPVILTFERKGLFSWKLVRIGFGL